MQTNARKTNIILKGLSKKGKIVNSICFQEEKARKTSFIEKEHTRRVCDRTKNEVFGRFLP